MRDGAKLMLSREMMPYADNSVICSFIAIPQKRAADIKYFITHGLFDNDDDFRLGKLRRISCADYYERHYLPRAPMLTARACLRRGALYFTIEFIDALIFSPAKMLARATRVTHFKASLMIFSLRWDVV